MNDPGPPIPPGSTPRSSKLVCGRELAGGFDRGGRDESWRGSPYIPIAHRSGNREGRRGRWEAVPTDSRTGVLYRLVSRKRPPAGGRPPGDGRHERGGPAQTRGPAPAG